MILDMCRYDFLSQTFYSIPGLLSAKNCIWPPGYKGNLKNTLEILKGIIGGKEVVTTIDQLLIEDKLTKNKQHIADKCNEYFTNIGPQLAEEIPFVQGSTNQYLKGVYKNSMFTLPATPDEIRGMINN